MAHLFAIESRFDRMNFDEFALIAIVDELAEEQQAREFADAVEFRLDTAHEPLDQISHFDGELPIIVSVRPDSNETVAMTDDVAETILRAVEYDAVEAVSLTLAAARANEQLLDDLVDMNITVIISYYDFAETPDRETLIGVVREASEYGNAVNISTMAETPDDTLTLLSTLSDAIDEGIVIGGASMGDIGRHTRVVAHNYGSKFAFAPLTLESKNTLPGQFPLRKLAELIEQANESKTTLHGSLTHHSTKDT